MFGWFKMDVFAKFRQMAERNDHEFVSQMADAIKSDLVEHIAKNKLDVTIENIPPIVSQFSMRNNVFKVDTFAAINDHVAKIEIESMKSRADLDKSMFRQCFTSTSSMESANDEIFEKIEALFDKKHVFIFPPLLLRHNRPESDMLVFKKTPSDEVPTTLLVFLKMGAVVPVVFDVLAFKSLLARYHFYSLENMNADEVRAYLLAQQHE